MASGIGISLAFALVLVATGYAMSARQLASRGKRVGLTVAGSGVHHVTRR